LARMSSGIIILGLVGLYALSKRGLRGSAPINISVPTSTQTGGYNVIDDELVPHYYPPSALTMFEDIGFKEPPIIIRATPLIEALGIPLKPVIVPGGKWIE